MCPSSMYRNGCTNAEMMESEKYREKEFINDLKQKLDELEHYAAASGSLEGVPTSVTMEKQRILIDQLRTKLDLELDDASVSKLSFVFAPSRIPSSFPAWFRAEELRKLVDQAIGQVVTRIELSKRQRCPLISS